MAAQDEAAGLAALSICESLMIALVEKGLLSVEEARGALEDAAAAHQGNGVAVGIRGRPQGRQELAAGLIERMATQVGAIGVSAVGVSAAAPTPGDGYGGGKG